MGHLRHLINLQSSLKNWRTNKATQVLWVHRRYVGTETKDDTLTIHQGDTNYQLLFTDLVEQSQYANGHTQTEQAAKTCMSGKVSEIHGGHGSATPAIIS